MDSITDLPDDIISKIFANLEMNDIAKLSCTCRRFNEVISAHGENITSNMRAIIADAWPLNPEKSAHLPIIYPEELPRKLINYRSNISLCTFRECPRLLTGNAKVKNYYFGVLSGQKFLDRRMSVIESLANITKKLPDNIRLIEYENLPISDKKKLAVITTDEDIDEKLKTIMTRKLRLNGLIIRAGLNSPISESTLITKYFRSLQVITLSDKLIKNVDMLYGIPEVSLYNCPMLKDISGLRECTSLSISKCDNIRKVVCAPNMNFLSITANKDIDLSSVRTARKIKLYCTANVILSLQHCEKLIVEGDNNISIENFPKIDVFEINQSLITFHLVDCIRFSRNLILNWCTLRPKILKMLSNCVGIHSLRINSSRIEEILEFLPPVKVLYIESMINSVIKKESIKAEKVIMSSSLICI